MRRMICNWLPMLFALGCGLLMAQSARAEIWAAPDLPCVPTVSDYEHGYKVQAGAFAIVWWCDDHTGLLTRWYTGTAPAAASQASAAVALAGRDPDAFLQTAFRRESSAAEMELVHAVEAVREPRCYVVGASSTAATAAVITETAQHTAGPAKLDATGTAVRIPVGQRVQCMSRIAKESKRYCEVRGAPDSKLRLIDGEAFAACRIERAPAEGWAQ